MTHAQPVTLPSGNPHYTNEGCQIILRQRFYKKKTFLERNGGGTGRVQVVLNMASIRVKAIVPLKVCFGSRGAPQVEKVVNKVLFYRLFQIGCDRPCKWLGWG